MLPDRRAVVFDMDDTLYPYRRFLLSGFAAVADHLHGTCGVSRPAVFRSLARASRGRDRGHELQACLDTYRLSPDLLPALLDRMLRHQPRLRLSRTAARTLAALRAGGWRVGVLTNGPHDVQSRKVDALDLPSRVDAVVYATQHGSGAGKPDPEPFAEVARRLDVPHDRVVFVGDDETCDIAGATAAGMIAVRCTAWMAATGSTAARAVAARLSHVPELAHLLLQETLNRHAA